MDNKVSQSEFQTGSDNNHRKLKRIAIILAVTLIPLSLIINFAPTFIARYLIESQFEKLGIEHQGIDTVRVNIFKREVWAGPLHIRMSDSDPGQLAELGIKIRFLPIFKKRAMFESVFIRGIDIFVARNQDNTLTLNGIPLNKFFPTGKDPETREDKRKPWGVGLDELELLDSRLIFKEKSGGVLTVEVDRVALRNIRSWDPEKLGNFNLAARVNDISLNWTGEVRPFADNITIAIDSHTNDASLPKIIRFIGPIGFERKGGVYNIHLKFNITLSASGQLNGKSIGTLEVIGLDYEREGKFTLAIDRSDIDLNTQFTLSEEGRFQIDGNAVVKATKTKVSATDNTYSAEGASVELNDLNLSFGAGSGFRLNTKTQIVVEKGEFSGTMPLSVASLLQLLRSLQSLSSGDTAAQQLAAPEDFAVSKVTLPKTDIKLSQLSSDSLFGLTVNKGEVSLDIDGKSELSEIQLVAIDRTTTIKKLSTNLDALEIRTGRGESSLRIAGGIDSSGYHIKGPTGDASAEEIKTVIQEAKLMIQPGKITLGASGSATLIGAKFLSLETNNLPQVTVSAETIMTKLKQASRIISSQQQVWDSEGEFKVDRLNIAFQKGETGSAKLQKLELRGVKADQDLHLTSDEIEISGLDLFVTRHFIDKLLTSIKGNKSKKDDNNTEQTGTLPLPSMVEEIQLRLVKLGFDAGPIDGRIGPRTQAAVLAFEEISGLPLVGLATKELLAALRDAEGPPVSLAIGRIALVDGAKIRFLDRQVEPAFEIETIFKTVELRDLNTKDPPGQAKASVVADINEFSHVELEGWFTPMGEQTNLEIKGKIENMELHPYSPYTAEFAGFRLDSGQLTAFADATAKQGNLTGNIELNLDNVDLATLTEKDKERLADKAGLPVETIVALLENKDGHIELIFPLTGTVTKPGIDLKPAIMKGIGGALKKVFPPTLVASLFSSGKGGNISFKPIIFSPGSSKLNDLAENYADGLLKLLQEYPKLSLDVCGRATAEDLTKKTGRPFKPPDSSYELNANSEKSKQDPEAMKRKSLIEKYGPEMKELAVERTSEVRRYLITEKGADPERLAECLPEFNPSDFGPPRVDVSPS